MMPANGQIELTWGDGDHVFNIAKIGQALELEEKCGAGIGTIITRLRAGTFFINDFRETIRLGLIGGGMEPPKAMQLVRRYVDARPWAESVLPAQAILTVAMVGVPGDDVGKKPIAEQTTSEPDAQPTAQMTGLSAPQSTAPAPPSDSPRDKSTSLPSGSLPPASMDTIDPRAAKSL